MTEPTEPTEPARPHLAREHLPVPDSKQVGLTTYDAKDPNTRISAGMAKQ